MIEIDGWTELLVALEPRVGHRAERAVRHGRLSVADQSETLLLQSAGRATIATGRPRFSQGD